MLWAPKYKKRIYIHTIFLERIANKIFEESLLKTSFVGKQIFYLQAKFYTAMAEEKRVNKYKLRSAANCIAIFFFFFKLTLVNYMYVLHFLALLASWLHQHRNAHIFAYLFNSSHLYWQTNTQFTISSEVTYTQWRTRTHTPKNANERAAMWALKIVCVRLWSVKLLWISIFFTLLSTENPPFATL